MKTRILACITVATLFAAFAIPRLAAQEQQAAAAPQAVTAQADGSNVPHLIKFSGGVNPQITQITQNQDNENAKSQAATQISMTFSLYELQEGGSPLWAETQSVQLDSQGHYTALLGAASPDGLPLDLFTNGQARWLGVQPQLAGAVEQPRVLLVGVPYALKAADADTLGGKPASAYALAGSQGLVAPAAAASSSSSGAAAGAQPTNPPAGPTTDGATSAPQPAGACTGVTADGKAKTPQVALYSSNCALTEDANFVDVTGKVGIGTASPTSPLDVVGTFGIGSSAANHSAVNVLAQWAPTVFDHTYSASGVNLAVMKNGSADSTGGIGLRGVGGVVENLGTGNVTGAAAMVGAVENLGTGTIASGYGSYLSSPIAAAGSPITNAYGLYIGGQQVTGVTHGFGIYATGPTDINYLGGSVGIGTKAPVAKLEVNGTSQFDSGVTFKEPVTFAAAQTFSGAITAVTHDTTLTGTGATGTPLGLTVPMALTNTNGAATITANNTGGSGSGVLGQAYNGYPGVEGNSISGNGVQGVTGPQSVVGAGAKAAGVRGDSKSLPGVLGTSDSYPGVWGESATQSGVLGTTSNAYPGVQGNNTGTGNGVQGVAGALSNVSGIPAAGVRGDSSSQPGVVGTSDTNSGVLGQTVYGAGVFGTSANGFGMATDRDAWQARGGGGWVKAMVYVGQENGTWNILRCYNSQAISLLGESADVSTPPCGFTFNYASPGTHYVDFGFQVTDRFLLANADASGGFPLTGLTFLNVTASQVQVKTYTVVPTAVPIDTGFYIFVF
jgi:trimeric autotransporter adhesin